MNTTYRIDFIGLTDRGLVREHNEDVWSAFPDENLFLLADGMGGHKGGEIAARIAVDSFRESFQKEMKKGEGDPISFFERAFSETNAIIYHKGKKDEALAGMGTTLVALYFFQEKVLLGHVGDSRIYRFRDNHLERMTEDHSLIGELLAMGAIKPEEVRGFPYQHILTKALGTHPKVSPTIHISDLKLKDFLLLCSDGVTNFISDQDIESVFRSDLDLKEKGKVLIELAKEHGGGDNITLILIEVGDDLSR